MALVRKAQVWAKQQISYSKSEAGSVSVLTLGLFLLALSAIILMTDLSSLTVAKSSLTHITEMAVQRGSHEINEAAYYDASISLPIDCASALARVIRELGNWGEGTGSSSRAEILSVELEEFICDGTSLEVHTKSEIRLPFKLPFTDTQNGEIRAMAVARNLIDPKSSMQRSG